ncbi:hypothetical protein T09_10323, partial [Trichinella sp. T9]
LVGAQNGPTLPNNSTALIPCTSEKIISSGTVRKTLSLIKPAIDPIAPDSEKKWKFWLLQFQDFVQLTVEPGSDLVKILRLYLSGSTFEYVQDCKTYDEAIAKRTLANRTNEAIAKRTLDEANIGV